MSRRLFRTSEPSSGSGAASNTPASPPPAAATTRQPGEGETSCQSCLAKSRGELPTLPKEDDCIRCRIDWQHMRLTRAQLILRCRDYRGVAEAVNSVPEAEKNIILSLLRSVDNSRIWGDLDHAVHDEYLRRNGLGGGIHVYDEDSIELLSQFMNLLDFGV